MAEERFKTTLMGGFDKDDVLNQVREMKDAAYAEKSKLIKEKKEQEKQIQELKKQLAKKDSEKAAALQKQKEAHKEEIAHLEERIQEKQKQKEKLEREISEKYQKYIDRYDLIGGLVLESEEKAEKIIREANEKAEQVLNDADQQAETTTQNARKAADQIVSEAIATRDELMDEAKKEAEKCLAAVQAEVDAKLADGKRKYIAVQDEMNEWLLIKKYIRLSVRCRKPCESWKMKRHPEKKKTKVQLLHRIICRRGSRSMKKISTKKRKIFPRKR